MFEDSVSRQVSSQVCWHFRINFRLVRMVTTLVLVLLMTLAGCRSSSVLKLVCSREQTVGLMHKPPASPMPESTTLTHQPLALPCPPNFSLTTAQRVTDRLIAVIGPLAFFRTDPERA
ncbi:hypothetical protein E2C01_023318 [Portunus trituberculatus]|uniref:Uncharacterized protein n=1 Tax=Portunus trituberculatus TaxID=210409 RepID=A0A5B7EBA0_PORTR|nr:hypothetical protein [Portunus trituberculatus]